MAFAAYVLENAILLFSPRVAIARFFKAPPWVFVWTAQPQGGAKISAALPKKNDKCPIDGRGMGTPGIDWAIITCHYGLRELSPLERVITSRYPGDYLDYFALLHQCVEKSDLLSIFGLLHLLPLFLTNILVWFFAFSKELWVGSIKSQVESCCFSLFSNWPLC